MATVVGSPIQVNRGDGWEAAAVLEIVGGLARVMVIEHRSIIGDVEHASTAPPGEPRWRTLEEGGA